eukprot:TRINITY_DN15881_c0_g2_i2.p1 TRINITY_DN15881_c0_g2~~TRINITY_DN15881_c0_g2_i2.p1  ORF type:complete len:504 (+),score=24.40 TRINITY_DN15881_c0_g2_i2:62-1513(+)
MGQPSVPPSLSPPPSLSGSCQVRCAGCRWILTVAPGLTEFSCPKCKMAQMLPPELMRSHLPPAAAHGIDPSKIQLPCAQCEAILNVPHGLSRFTCPLCGVDLAVDLSKLPHRVSSPAPPAPEPPEQVNEVYPTQVSSSEGTSTPAKKKGRGPTKCNYINKLPNGVKLRVGVKNGQVIGKHASKLSNWCGRLARNGRLLPIDCLSWRIVDKEGKDRVWKMVLEKFDIDEAMKHYVMQSVGKKWRDNKCELKAKYYDNGATTEDRYAHCPPSVIPDHWKTLVNFWDSEEGKKRSERNKKNRSHLTLPHTAGTKSFARLRDEEQSKSETQSSPTRAEFFVKTHVHKDGSAVNSEAADKIREMQDWITREGSQDSTSRNDIFSRVMGPERNGRVRGYGLGLTPSSLWGSLPRPSASEFTEMKNKLHQMEEQMNSTVQQMEERLHSTKHQMEEQMKQKDAEILELRSMIQAIYSRQGVQYPPMVPPSS